MLAFPAVPLMAKTTTASLVHHTTKKLVHHTTKKLVHHTTKKSSHTLSSKSKTHTTAATSGRPLVKVSHIPPTIDNIHT